MRQLLQTELLRYLQTEGSTNNLADKFQLVGDFANTIVGLSQTFSADKFFRTLCFTRIRLKSLKEKYRYITCEAGEKCGN